MTFVEPTYLLLGGGLVLLSLLGLLSHTRRRRRLAEFLGGPRAAARLSRFDLYRFRWERGLLLALAAVALAAAAAEPRLPDVPVPEPTPPPIHSTVFAIDISASMQATDAVPNRLGRAVAIVDELMADMEDDRFGLVLFAGTAYPIAPPTADHQALRYLLGGVTPTIASAWDPGSSPAAGLAAALEMLPGVDDPTAVRTIVLIADGEAGEPRRGALAAVDSAVALGVTVHTIGVGTSRGSGMVMPRGQFQLGGPVLDPASATPATSRLREAELETIASAGNGRYVHADDPAAIAGLRRTLERPPLAVVQAEPTPLLSRYDLTSILAAFALLLLFLESVLDVRLPAIALVTSRPAARRPA